MITDIILLITLFAIIFGIIKLVSLVAPPPPTSNSSSSKTSSATKTTHTIPPAEGTSFDWQKGEINLKTNLRPVSQQELLELADQRGRDSGKFVAQHADSFSFGKKHP